MAGNGSEGVRVSSKVLNISVETVNGQQKHFVSTSAQRREVFDLLVSNKATRAPLAPRQLGRSGLRSLAALITYVALSGCDLQT